MALRLPTARSFAVLVLFLLTWLLLADTALAQAPAWKAWGEQPESGVFDAATDKPLRLVVHVEANGAAVPDQLVKWSIDGGGDALLSHAESRTSGGGEQQPPAGEASVMFTARAGGQFEVLAAVDAPSGCSEDCARKEVRFRVAVAGEGAPEPAQAKEGGHAGMIAAIAGAAAVVAIYAGNDSSSDSPVSRTLAQVSGDGQSAPEGAGLSAPLVVEANNDGRPANTNILWSASGGATLSATSSQTDSAGRAQVSVTSVGPGPGPVTITATRGDRPISTVFTAHVLTRALTIVSGNGQSAPVNSTLPAPLVVAALVGNTPQSGIGINWAVVSGDASIASSTGSTNGSGQASATIDLGPTPGSVVVRASRADNPSLSVTFNLNALLVRSLSIISGDNQTAAPNAPLPAPLTVNAQDNGANASGVTINWFASGGATLSAASSVTNGAGLASVTVTDMGPGPDPVTISAVRADDPSGQVIFTENILPPSLSIAAGDNQSGLTGSAAAAPLDVLLVDGANAPASGQTINWAVTSGSAILASGSSITDGSGHATMAFSFGSFPGPIAIQASAYNGSQAVSFSATALTASGLNKTSGDNQSANPGLVLAPMVVTIVPPAGVTDLSGVPVTFTLTSGSGTLSTTSTTTDASGQASTTLTLGLTPGAFTVVAQVDNGPSVTFSGTILGSLVATNLQVVSGDAQTLQLGAPSAPMVVELRNGTTPLAGLTVTWATNNGVTTPTSSVTDSNGRASATVTPNSAGPVAVTASFAAYAQYTASSVSFTHNTSLGSLPNLSTDQVAVAVALDNACTELSGESALSSDEQDLLHQCQAMAAASGSDPGSVADAIQEVLPDVAKTQTQTGEQAVNAQFDNLKGRIATLRAGVRAPALGGLMLSTPTGVVSLGMLAKSLSDEPATVAEESASGRWGFFASGNIGRGHTDRIDDAPSYNLDVKGITAGVDYRVSDSLVYGIAFGYTKQDTKLSAGQGSVGLRGLSISAYSTWYHEKDWYVDGAISLADNDFRHRRRIEYTLPGQNVDQTARADSDGQDASATLTLGRDFQDKEWTFGLYGTALYSHQSFDSFDEELDSALAGSGLALHVADRSVNSLSSVFGGRASLAHSVSWGVVMPQFGLEWQHEYSGDPDAFRAFLISDPTNTPILVTGDALDNSYFRLNLGLGLIWTKGRSGFIHYDRIFSRDANTMENLSIGFRMEF